MIAAHLVHDAQAIEYLPPKLILAVSPQAPLNLVSTLQKLVGEEWSISIIEGLPQNTLGKERALQKEQKKDDLLNSPIIKGILDYFPGTTVKTS